jgi:hypothetical protein
MGPGTPPASHREKPLMTHESTMTPAFQTQILDQIHDSVVATDLRGLITFWNKGAERLYGYTAEEAVGKHISLVYPPEQHSVLDAKRLDPLLESGFQEFDAILLAKSGWLRPIHARLSLIRDAANEPAGILSLSIDNSDLQSARANLHDRERQLRTILDAIPTVVVHLDPQLRLKFANKAYESLVNCSSCNLLGRQCGHLFESASPAVPQRPNDTEALSGSAGTCELEMTCQGGVRRRLAIQRIPDIGAGGDLQGYFVVGTDVTEARRIEAVRLEEERRLRETLTSEVHHRVKNSLQGTVGLLRAQAAKSVELADALAPAIAQVLSISVGFGLMSTRSERGIVLCDMVREISRNLEQITGASISTEVDEAILEQPIVLDRRYGVNLGMIVNELIFNAVKHGKAPAEGPRIVVSMSRNLESSTVRISNCVDSTCGRFDLQSGAAQGTGLGLVRALLPPAGSHLSFVAEAGRVTAVLQLNCDTLGPANRDL